MTKENSTLLKRLAQYSAMTAPAIAVAGMANAQVVYTDVDPDFELTSSPGDIASAVIDLDNDGVSDFILAAFSSVSGVGGKLNLAGAVAYSGNGNGIMGYTSGPFFYPSALEANAEINEGENFFGYLSGYVGSLLWYYIPGGGASGTFGQWYNVEDMYMGVRFVDGGGNLHYGWVRMDVEANPVKIVVKDYAYDETPDKGILAGSTISLGVNQVNLTDNFGIFSFDRNVFIQAPANLSGSMTVSITDMTGKVVLEQAYSDGNVRISVKDLASGIYVVKAIRGGQEKTRKISVQ
jgi:hypothetical protein